jgi:hypothetical protein
MREATPGDLHRAIEGEVRQALARRIAEADGYAHRRKMDLVAPMTAMSISKGILKVTITIQSEWKDEDTPELETK